MSLSNILSKSEWLVEEKGFNIQNLNVNETLFTVGNGYLGTRGSLEEGIKGELPGNFIAGIFDHYDSMVIDLVNTPLWTPVNIYISGYKLNMNSCKVLDSYRCLDMRKGLLYRRTRFEDPNGNISVYESVRFASFHNNHLCVIRFSLTPENYSGDVRIETAIEGEQYNLAETPYLVTGAKKKVFPIEEKWVKYAKARHMKHIKSEGSESNVYLEMKTLDTQHTLGFASELICENTEQEVENFVGFEFARQQLNLDAKKGQTYTFSKLTSIYTSRDVSADTVQSACIENLNQESSKGYPVILQEHIDTWNIKWDNSDCLITGDDDSAFALRFNIFQLLICAYEKDPKVNIGAKTLSGEGYRGHVFWDTEIFLLPFYIYTQPETAKSLLLYRYHTLEAAKENAKLNGYDGSQYPWEAADTGKECTPKWTPDMTERIWTGEEEIHITADVAYGILTYYFATGDIDFFLNYGAEILILTARFWSSRLEYNKDKDRYEMNKVIGPDEYHEHVNNSVFTNWMAKWNMEKTIDCCETIKIEHPTVWLKLSQKTKINDQEIIDWKNKLSKIYIPFNKEKKLIEQFEGYFELEETPIVEFDENDMPLYPKGIDDTNAKKTTLIKQPDIVMLMFILPDEFSDEIKKINYEFYEKRTMHKSSLSPSIYSIMGIEINNTEHADQYFKRSAFVDLANNQGNTDMGIHAASCGGTWQCAVFGFGGFRLKQHKMTFKPWLPEKWVEVKFKLQWRSNQVEVAIQKAKAFFTLVSNDNNAKEEIIVFDKAYELKANKSLEVGY